jgi:CBS domain-containing protein
MGPITSPLRQYMHAPVHTIAPADPLVDASLRMTEFGVSSLPVVDEHGRAVGLITRTDLLRVGVATFPSGFADMVLHLPRKRVDEVMTRDPVWLSADAPLSHAARAMARRGMHRVLVIDEDRIVGIVSTSDVMRAVAAANVREPIAAVISGAVDAVRVSDAVTDAIGRLHRAHFRALVVMDEDKPVGVFGQAEALVAQHLDAPARVGDWMDARILSLPISTSLSEAAKLCAASDVQLVIVCDDTDVRGVVSATDFLHAAF